MIPPSTRLATPGSPPERLPSARHGAASRASCWGRGLRARQFFVCCDQGEKKKKIFSFFFPALLLRNVRKLKRKNIYEYLCLKSRADSQQQGCVSETRDPGQDPGAEQKGKACTPASAQSAWCWGRCVQLWDSFTELDSGRRAGDALLLLCSLGWGLGFGVWALFLGQSWGRTQPIWVPAPSSWAMTHCSSAPLPDPQGL